MKTYNKLIAPIASILVLLICFNSCVVNKPDLNGISSRDYNSRRKVTGAHYTKRLSVPGIVLTAAAPVAGAVAGYNINMITVQKGEETHPIKPANAAIGAIAGYSIANFINYCMGLNEQKPAHDPAQWTKSISSQYTYIPNTKESEGKFLIIDKSAEKNYQVRDFVDTKHFYAAFPYSQYKNSIFQKSINVCTRSQLLDLIALDGKNTYVNDAKKKYILMSSTYDELAAARNKYPEIQVDYENLFAGLVKTISNAIDFHNRYPKSKLSKKVIWAAFTTTNPSTTDVYAMKRAYGNAINMTKADLSCSPTEQQKCNYLRSMYQTASIKNETDLEIFYRQYGWLTYNDKAKDIASNVFNVAYNSFDNGNYLLYYMKQLPNDKLYKSWGLTKSIVQETIDTKMKDEASKVKIVSTKSLGQNNTDWQKWVNNTTYTAGLVAESGKVKYIIYGEIENKSKFDLPVVVSASADLIAEASMKTKGGFLGKLFSALFDAAAQQQGVKEKKVSSCNRQFIIPSLPAKSKSSYAILLDFGNNGNVGVNVADWFKVATEAKMKNLKVSQTVSKQSASYSVLSEQEKWLDMAKNGMPGVALTDLKRNERVNDQVWAQRWEVEKQRRAEAAARYEAERAQREAREKSEKAVEEAVKKEVANRQYTKKFKASYETVMPAYKCTEWYVTFGDGTRGFLGYGYSDRWSYCSDALFNDPGSLGNPMSCWHGGYKTEQEAINELYNDLHR